MPACAVRTSTISSVAYAVDEIASDANTGSATILRRRWWCSSDVAIGVPISTRLTSDALPIDIAIASPGADLETRDVRSHRRHPSEIA